MNRAKDVIDKLMREESGQDLIEYAIVAGLIGLGAVVSLTSLPNKIKTGFTKRIHGVIRPDRNGLPGMPISIRYLKCSGMSAAEPMHRMVQSQLMTWSCLIKSETQL